MKTLPLILFVMIAVSSMEERCGGTVRGTFWVATWAMWGARNPDWRGLTHSCSWHGNEGFLDGAT